MDVWMLLLAVVLAAFAGVDAYRVVTTEVDGDEAEVAAAKAVKGRRTIAAVVTGLGAIASLYLAFNGGW